MTFGSRVARAAANHVERDPEPPVRAEADARRRRDGVEQRVQVGIRGIGYPTMCPMVLHKFQRRHTASFIVNFGAAADDRKSNSTTESGPCEHAVIKGVP